MIEGVKNQERRVQTRICYWNLPPSNYHCTRSNKRTRTKKPMRDVSGLKKEKSKEEKTKSEGETQWCFRNSIKESNWVKLSIPPSTHSHVLWKEYKQRDFSQEKPANGHQKQKRFGEGENTKRKNRKSKTIRQTAQTVSEFFFLHPLTSTRHWSN